MIWILGVRKAGKTLTLIFISIICSGLFDALQYVSALHFEHNLFVANIYPVAGFAIPFLAYYLHQDFTTPIRKGIAITGFIGITILLFNISQKDTNELIVLNLVILSISLIILSLFYFVHKIYFTTEFDILKHPLFYVSSAQFVYHISCVTIFSTYDLIPGESYDTLWALKLLFYILYNAILAYSFVIFKKYKIML